MSTRTEKAEIRRLKRELELLKADRERWGKILNHPGHSRSGVAKARINIIDSKIKAIEDRLSK